MEFSRFERKVYLIHALDALAAIGLLWWGMNGVIGLACTKSDPDKEATGQEVQLGVNEPDDEGWLIANSFVTQPTNERLREAIELLEDVASGRRAHATDVVLVILEEIAERQLATAGPAVVHILDADGGATSRSNTVMRVALRTLVAINREGAYETLERVAVRATPEVLETVALSLGQVTDERATTLLERLARRPEPEVQERAIGALAERCCDSSRAIVLKGTMSPNDAVRVAAVWWLARCGGESDEASLLHALSDREILVRAHGLRGLLRLNNPAGCELLAPLLEDPSDTVRALAAEYQRLCQKSGSASAEGCATSARSGP